MKKSLGLVTLLFLFSSFMSCLTDVDRKNESSPKNLDKKDQLELEREKFDKAVIHILRRRNVLIKTEYEKLDDAYKRKTSLQDYSHDLKRRYSACLKEKYDAFLNLEEGKRSKKEIKEMIDTLLQRYEIPIWYSQLMDTLTLKR